MASSGKIEIKKFNGYSFELWKLKMEDLLVDKYQRIMVDPGTKPTGVSNEEWKKLDQKAKSIIRLCVSDSILLNVSGEARTKTLWDKLGTLYQSKSLMNKLFLRKKFYNLRMKDGDSMTEHLNAFNTVEYHDASSEEAKTTSDEGGDVYLASSSTHVDHEAWLTKSGASFHFNPHTEWFCEYEKYDGGDIFLGDDRQARIVGRGNVNLKLEAGRVRTLPSVLHITALARNMISVSKLDDAGVKTLFKKHTYKMVQGALVLMWRVRTGNLYKLQGSTVVDACNSSVVPESGGENLVVSGEKNMLRHQRFQHIGEKGLQILHGKGMVEGMSNSSLDFDLCENCVYGKQNQVSFPSSGKRVKHILELVHSDVFGPMKVPSLGKSVYYVSFINDLSRNTWIYFLKKKFEVFDRFKRFKALVENQTEKKIKLLRTNNGGEFCSKKFE
eukprot:PITA_10242